MTAIYATLNFHAELHDLPQYDAKDYLNMMPLVKLLPKNTYKKIIISWPWRGLSWGCKYEIVFAKFL